MINKYFIQTELIDGKIRQVVYVRETKDFFVSENGQRVKKKTKGQEHFDTRQEAKDRLIEVQFIQVTKAFDNYNFQRAKFVTIKKI